MPDVTRFNPLAAFDTEAPDCGEQAHTIADAVMATLLSPETESLAASVRKLIADLQPGEVLRIDDDGVAFYERATADGRCIERRYLDGDMFSETISAVIMPEIDAQSRLGELAYGPGCSEWHRPAI